MAAIDVTQYLLHAQDADASVRQQAEAALTQFEAQNYPAFLYSLAMELANTTKPADARQLAGLVLKNKLDAREELRKQELQVGKALQ